MTASFFFQEEEEEAVLNVIVNIKELLTEEIKAMETGVFIRKECLFHPGVQNTTEKKGGIATY